MTATPGNGAYSGNALPNTVQSAQIYIKQVLDEILAIEAKTNGMTPNPAVVQAAGQGGSIKLATIETTGLGDYSTQKGYPMGAAKCTWQEYTLSYNRAIKYVADEAESIKSGGVATAMAFAAEAMRSHIIPEIDAARMSKVYSNVSTNAASNVVTESAALTAANLLTKIEDGICTVQNETGIDSGLTVYLNASLRKFLKLSTEVTKNKSVDRAGASGALGFGVDNIDGNPIVWVPSTRMYTAITTLDGYTNAYSDTTAGSVTVDYNKFGYAKASGANDLNFAICAPDTAMGVVAINNPKIVAKEQSENYDADSYMIHIWHDLVLPKNKCKACYVSVANE